MAFGSMVKASGSVKGIQDCVLVGQCTEGVRV